MNFRLFAAFLGIFSLSFAPGIETPDSTVRADEVEFESQIRAVLKDRCGNCHGAKVQKSGLRLDARSSALKGGDGGRVIVPGKSSESELIRRISSQAEDVKMPPEGPALSAEEIARLSKWIDAGANWPETDYDREANRDRRLEHWAWQPIRDVAPPTNAAIKSGSPYKSSQSSTPLTDPRLNEIDRFVVSKLTENGLALSPEADRRTLIRRLSFDLLGLPPETTRVNRFVNDTNPTAYAELVDEMLSSPHYGERWARHWLDIAHYADTHGFERDQRRDHAWRYRDWVIRAFNADMPYNQFLRDQIAGDVLRPEDPSAVIATGFLAAGPWDFVGQAETPSPILKRLARADDLDDMVTQVITSTCGVTVNCARCHDHKLDPIPQQDYYSLWSVFAGLKRSNRVVVPAQEKELNETRADLEKQIAKARSDLNHLRGAGWSLADLVGGGDGLGSGKVGSGIDPASGKPQTKPRAFLDDAVPNRFASSTLKYVDGVVIPDGGATGEVTVSSTGLVAKTVPKTSGKAWDAIRNGAVNSQFSTKLGDIDFSAEGHSLLSLHANAAITFDVESLRRNAIPDELKTAPLKLKAFGGYFGQTPQSGASIHIFLDGKTVLEKMNIGRDDGLIAIDITIPQEVRFLTLMSTDGGNGIGHDQICFGDARLEPSVPMVIADKADRIVELTHNLERLQKTLGALGEPDRVYGVVSETPPAIHILARGDTEQPKEQVNPGALSCLKMLPSQWSGTTMTDAERRIALANWIVNPQNPLPRRVIVNRLWQHHFGTGLVDTPSDFGLGGSLPSHPELLDWLASRLLKENWSLKSIHRMICLSATYRQTSDITAFDSNERPKNGEPPNATAIDAGNRLLWRFTPRRLDAESLRDSVLFVSGKLNPSMYGPGYRDFEYKEEYAPVYTYITANHPDLWKRSIYRFIVRTTPHQFLTTLDCPNPANLTPTRTVTTTALQALALWNDEFMLQQSAYFADRISTSIQSEKGATSPEDHSNESLVRKQISLAFQLALNREPSTDELRAAERLVTRYGLKQLCRSLFNSSEFVFID